MKILLATNNIKKIEEINSKMKNSNIEFIRPIDVGLVNFQVTEDGTTLEENALLKAKAFFDKTNLPVISDDSGLFVDALNGEPGVYSARYSGENATDDDNCNKLLFELKDIENRSAKFKTIICYYDSKQFNFFEGICVGSINLG